MTFDYDGILSYLENQLSLLNNWANTLFYGTYRRITSAVSYTIEKLVFVAETYYRESVWGTAEKRSSLVKKSQWLGYKVSRKKGASGNVLVSADSSFSSVYTYSGITTRIEKWTRLSNGDGDVKVYVTADTIYANGTVGNLTVPVKQGTVVEYTYTASGASNEVISIYSDSIENDYIQVDIVDSNGVVLNNVNICGEGDNEDKLYFITDITNYYCEVYNDDEFESVNVKFGDGVYGRRLIAGEKVKITYATTDGDDGNILQTGVITKFSDTLNDANGNEVTLYCNNTSEISNGSDIEDIEHIRNYGSNLWVSGYRCGSANDWKTNLENHPYIYKAQVLNMDEIGSTDSADVNKVFVTAISTDGSELTTDQKAEVVIDLKDDSLKSVTEIVEWRDPNIIFLKWEIDGYVENQPFTTITDLINTTLESNYGILNVDFQDNVYQSNYYDIIQGVNYIDHHETEVWYLEKNFSALVSSYTIAPSYTLTDTSTSDDQIYIQPNTFEIWIHRKRSGVWDALPYKIAEESSNVVAGLAGDLPSGLLYTVTNAFVDYDDNLISFMVNTILNDPTSYGVRNPGASDDDGYIISIAYKTQDGNSGQLNDIRFPTNQFISDFDETYSFIDLEYV